MNKVSECEGAIEKKAQEKLKKGAVYFGHDEYYLAVVVAVGKGYLLYSLHTGSIWSWGAERYVPTDFARVPKGTCIKIITE